ncbi:hypothetical protein D3C76_156930 [compost metagenome]
MGFFIQIVERSAGPQTARILDEELTFRQIQRHGFGGVGLQFQGMRPGLGRCLDDLQGHVQRLVMVATHLGDDEGRRIGTDQAVADLETSHAGDPSKHG